MSAHGMPISLRFLRRPVCFPPAVGGPGSSAHGEEIEFLWRRYRFDDLNFQDELSFRIGRGLWQSRRSSCAENCASRGRAHCAADQGSRMADDELALCVRSGLRRVMVGVESGSQHMLNTMKKDILLTPGN